MRTLVGSMTAPSRRLAGTVAGPTTMLAVVVSAGTSNQYAPDTSPSLGPAWRPSTTVPSASRTLTSRAATVPKSSNAEPPSSASASTMRKARSGEDGVTTSASPNPVEGPGENHDSLARRRVTLSEEVAVPSSARTTRSAFTSVTTSGPFASR